MHVCIVLDEIMATQIQFSVERELDDGFLDVNYPVKNNLFYKPFIEKHDDRRIKTDFPTNRQLSQEKTYSIPSIKIES